MESAAIVTGITIFIAVILALGGPELLRSLARRNRERYELLLPALEALGRQLRETAAALREFRALEADIYQKIYADTRGEMETAVNAFKAAQQQQALLRLPAVSEEGFAVLHVLRAPNLLATIPRDGTRLGRMQGQLTRARQNLGKVRAGLDALAHVPGDLQARARNLSNQELQELSQTLAAEEEAGVGGLEAWQARRAELEEEARTLAQLLRREPDQPLSQLDALAQALGRVEEATEALVAEVAEMVEARRLLDEGLERTRATQERLERDEAPLLAPLLSRSRRLLEVGANARKEGAVADAREAVEQAQALLTLANGLAEVAKKVGALEAVADVSLEATEIADLAQAQQRAQGSVRERLALSANGEQVLLGSGALQLVDRLQRQARELDARADRLLQLHKAHTAELEEEAAREAQTLAAAWQRLQELMPPAPGDPLANQRELLERQRVAAAGKPALLRAYVGEARGLATRVADTASYLDQNLRWAAGLRDEISALLATAEQEAEGWRSLQPFVGQIKESAAEIWQIEPAAAATLEEAYEALDELQARQEQALDAWEALQAGRQRLDAVAQRIARTEGALETEAVDPAEWEGVAQLARGYFADAEQAESVEEAVMALQQAHSVLQNVVTGR